MAGTALSIKSLYGRLVPVQQVTSLLAKETDVGRVADFAKAVEAAKFLDGNNQERVNYWGELAIWSTRRLGELLKEGQEDGAIEKRGGDRKSNSPDGSLMLKDIGITYNQSSRAQKIAAVQPKKITAFVAEQRKKGDEVSKAGLLKFVGARREAARYEEAQLTKPPTGKYSVILADPPWAYDFSETASRKIDRKYPTMSLQEICDLPVPAAADCVLFLWATAPKLREALTVMETWGFKYKTHAIWDKQMIGMGYWFRGRHELLLVGTKGKAQPPAQKDRPASVFSEKRTGHSIKPKVAYEIIEAMFPEAKRCELFQRAPRKGWKGWGAESP